MYGESSEKLRRDKGGVKSMNILWIKEKTLLSEEPLTYWKLALVKSISLLSICVIGTTMMLSIFGIATFVHSSQVARLGLPILSLFLFSHFWMSNKKRFKVGSWIYVGLLVSLVGILPYLQQMGLFAPAFYQIPVVIMISYIILGFKGAVLSGGFFLSLQILQNTGLTPFLSLSSHYSDVDPVLIASHQRARLVSILVTAPCLFILHKINLSMREALANEKEKLEKAQKYKILGDVAAGMAHEINNPLGIADGHIWQLKRELEDIKQSKRLEKIEHALGRISSIISTFLAIFDSGNTSKSTLNFFDISASLKNRIIDDRLLINISPHLSFSSHHYLLLRLMEIISENGLEAVDEAGRGSVVWEFRAPSQIVCVDDGLGFVDKKFEEARRPFVTGRFDKRKKGLGLFNAEIIAEKLGAELKYNRVGSQTEIILDFKEGGFCYGEPTLETIKDYVA
jgi:signal transduction histidine kinase